MPFADVLYGCDYLWWQKYGGVPEFTGLKLSVDRKVSDRRDWNVKAVGVNKNDDRLELLKIGTVGWGGNGGFHALNLAIQFGAAKIILVGYDMRLDHGLHWHGRHPNGLNNPTDPNVARWRRCIDAAAEVITALDVTVINASPISALQNYPKMSLIEALK